MVVFVFFYYYFLFRSSAAFFVLFMCIHMIGIFIIKISDPAALFTSKATLILKPEIL